MSYVLNALFDTNKPHFDKFITNNREFKFKLVEAVENEDAPFKNYGEFVSRALDCIDGIEKSYDLLMDVMSDIYMQDENYDPIIPDTSDTATIFTSTNFADVVNKARQKVYIPFLKVCWQFTEALRGNVYNSYKNHQKYHTEYTLMFGAIRAIEKNIVDLLRALA